MRNRAKCKLCQITIESLHTQDYQLCDCMEIAVDGGSEKMIAYARDWNNFVRIDDNDKEVIPKIVNKQEVKDMDEKTDKEILIDSIENLISAYERLPENAMTMPITHYDMLSILYMIKKIALN